MSQQPQTDPRIHPQIAEILAHIPASDGSAPSVEGWRGAEESRVPAPAERTPQLPRVRDAVAAAAHGDVPVRIYTPDEREQRGVIVYFHGGAFFSGSLDTHDGAARALAAESGLTVVSVGYRRVPEDAFPAGLEDCYGVLRWTAEHGSEQLGWDGGTLAVAGDSSGGTYAAAVTGMARDDGFEGITHQVLLYPSVDLDFTEAGTARYPSRTENATGYGLETAGLVGHNSFYLDSGADPADPLVSPIRRDDLSGLPKGLVITAQFDPLRDEGEAYAARLRQAGVEATVSRYGSANHGFMVNFAWIPELYQAFTEVGRFLNQG
ncbi:alpha/beta hydrolase [Citricoccus parietis]